VYLNPREGTKAAVAEAARNIVCSGGKPLAITNCLNFGNPYKPEMYWLFKESIAGMKEACEYFETPVTGGNVSFYNESPDRAVYPTPVIGMIGIINDLKNVTSCYFKNEGDVIFVLGEDFEELGGSEYVKVIHNLVKGDSPKLNLERERNLHSCLLEMIDNGFVNSAHDVSEGGILSALAECCITNEENQIGCEVEIPVKSRKDFSYFSESQSRIIISVDSQNEKKVFKFAEKYNVPAQKLGKVSGTFFKVNNDLDIDINKLSDVYFNTISRIMNE